MFYSRAPESADTASFSLNIYHYLTMVVLCVRISSAQFLFVLLLLPQTFLAPVSQVFPAEDDVNKHMEDNCESLCVLTVSLSRACER